MKTWVPLLSALLYVSVALAEPPAPSSNPTQEAASALVKKQVLQPLQRAESKRSRFSRAGLPPRARRVRVTDEVAVSDAHGNRFVRFSVDERLAWDEDGAWNEDAIVGCAYPEEKKVYVKREEAYVPASVLLGRDEKTQSGVCETAITEPAKLAVATPTARSF